MFITSKTTLTVNGRETRVCGRHFNRAMKRGFTAFTLPTGEKLIPSKGRAWNEVAALVRAGKKVQATAG